MKSRLIVLALAGALLGAPLGAAAPGWDGQEGPEAKAALAKMTPDQRKLAMAFDHGLTRHGGHVAIPGGHASLELGAAYYFLSAEDAKRVLVEAWGNPPDDNRNVLGMVVPAGRSIYDGTWGAVIEYDDSGHVVDKDAAEQDYEQVLADMRSAAEDANAARTKAGYPAIHIAGWAQPPSYDAAGRTLIWARDLKFDGGGDIDTLNYDVRKLSRTGVLSLNMVDTMDHLPAVRAAAAELGRTVRFDPGQAYADFDSKTDHLADYGLAGLVAAGAGLAIAKKVGVLGILLLFLKKGFVIVAVAAAAMWRRIKRLFGRGDDAEADEASLRERAGEAMARIEAAHAAARAGQGEATLSPNADWTRLQAYLPMLALGDDLALYERYCSPEEEQQAKRIERAHSQARRETVYLLTRERQPLDDHLAQVDADLDALAASGEFSGFSIDLAREELHRHLPGQVGAGRIRRLATRWGVPLLGLIAAAVALYLKYLAASDAL